MLLQPPSVAHGHQDDSLWRIQAWVIERFGKFHSILEPVSKP